MAMPISIVGNAFHEAWKNRALIILISKTRQRLIQNGYTEQALAELFRRIDVDKSGAVDLAEFKQMLGLLKLRLRTGAVLALFRYFDSEGRGSVTLDEFKKALSLPKH